MSKFNEPRQKIFRFPDASFIKPGRELNSTPESQQPTSSVRDTFFANTFRKWKKEGRIGYNVAIHDAFRDAMLDYIERFVAIHMVTDDITKSAQSTGTALEMDTDKVNSTAESLLEMRLYRDIARVVGLADIAEDIIQRELDKVFGSAPLQAAERRKHIQQTNDDRDWLRTTVAGIHNMLRDASSSLTSINNNATQAAKLKPADPTKHSHHLLSQMLSELRTGNQSTETEHSTESLEETS